MEYYVIRGGRPLAGRLRVLGAKNAALPLLAAAVLARDECVLVDVPDLRDIDVMVAILRRLGAHVREERRDGLRALRVRAPEHLGTDVPSDLMAQMRSSIVLMGALLAREGRVRVVQPGGCAIGARPIDLHLQAMRNLGAIVEEAGRVVTATVGPQGLRGATIAFPLPSVGATENAMLVAVLAQGVTVIRNAAREPEIVDLQAFLNAMGARVEGAGSPVIVVRGVPRLGGAVHRVIPDRIEAGTFLLAAAITGGEIHLENARPDHMEAVLEALRQTGATVLAEKGHIFLRGPRRPQPLALTSSPFPGFPTDLQNQFLALLSRAEGTSIVAETVFENRFRIVPALNAMGARITVDGRVAVVRGVPRLQGADVEVQDDLRGGAALVLAGLAAQGRTVVRGLADIRRGYQDFDARLRHLGADIALVSDENVGSGDGRGGTAAAEPVPALAGGA
ncbi:MAG: UDP-N-acetylglucosamine 1-carboxyvinyltransferase [Clostridia bacterium]|nr:UDP-N-acetylglucosamine 1-carboxyvinyltransferase [Clostridia bacterium]